MSRSANSSNQSIAIKSLRKEFNVPTGTEVAVDGIDITMGEDEFLTFVGPSGCGKTTTLRCIAGLEMPTSGVILFDGSDVTDTPVHKRNIAMMFQDIALYPHMKVIDNIAYPLKVRNVPKSERHEEARQAAEIMQISELIDKYPGELSGGQQQRAALARTIVYDPQLFLMDEPLSDLDAKLKVDMREEIQRIHKRLRKPTIYVTHDQQEALTMSDRVAVMSDGHIEQISPPDELYEYPVNTFVATFIGNPSMNLLNASIREFNGDVATVQLEDTQFDMEMTEINSDMPESIIIGIRPEDISLGTSEWGLDVEINLIERIDNRLLTTLTGPQGELKATVLADTPVEEETEEMIWFDQNLYVFDRTSKERIGKGVVINQNR